MTEYLPLTGETGPDRSQSEAMQRSAGLQVGDVTQFWHGWITHPLTGQDALVIQNEDDKEFLTAAELAALLTEQEATAADWFLGFEVIL